VERSGYRVGGLAAYRQPESWKTDVKMRGSKMSRHLALIGGITTLIVLSIFYPFLPGRYDELAVALSTMAQVCTVAGLLLVPIGALWLFYELRKRAPGKRNLPHKKRGYYFALASVITGSIVAVAVSLSAFASIGLSFGFLTLALWFGIFSRLTSKLKVLKDAEAENFNPVPLYLIFVPGVVLLFQTTLASAATEFSRNYAIANSAELINDIEAYHAAAGYYPRSLSALWHDYKPSVIGIKQFHYAPSGDAYNLFFEQPTFVFRSLGTREIVMYNKRDQHVMISHAMDILRWTPEQLATRRGWYAVHDASSPHWKYFWFD
jgi:hypothetical protein